MHATTMFFPHFVSSCAEHAWFNANRRQHMIDDLTVAGLSDMGVQLKHHCNRPWCQGPSTFNAAAMSEYHRRRIAANIAKLPELLRRGGRRQGQR